MSTQHYTFWEKTMTLYLKYRPQTLGELDSEDVRESLKKIVGGSIPHAFLFSGPKGTGKTSAARILAKIVNCESAKLGEMGEPCNKCYQCESISKGTNVDVLEMDAASHRGIDDVRLLREQTKLANARARTKVYIIDEAHMLTAEAGAALLKTLEEPPKHVIFILATTNPEKLSETIRSRCTIIRFKKAREEEIVRELKRACAGEGIKAPEEVMRLIARSSGGSFRDAHKILEQMILEKISFDTQSVEKFLIKGSRIEALLAYLIKKDAAYAVREVNRLVDEGVFVDLISENLLTSLRASLLAKIGLGEDNIPELQKKDLIKLIKLISASIRELRDTSIEELPLQLAIIKWCETNIKSQNEIKIKGRDAGGLGNGRGEGVTSIKSAEPVKLAASAESTTSEKLEKKIDGREKTTNGFSGEIWASVLGKIRPKNTSTEALLRASKPISFDGQTLELGVYYRFHKERLESVAHRAIVEDALHEVLGNKVKLICELTPSPAKPSVVPESNSVLTETEDSDIIKVAKEIFGS